MRDNTNMLKKHNNRSEMKTVAKKKFYGIVEYSVQVMDTETGKMKSVNKTGVLKTEHKMTRLEAMKEIKAMAKTMNGKITFVGAIGN